MEKDTGKTTNSKKISPKWSEFAESWLGDRDGKHCHWCKHIKHDDGYSFCVHPKSEFNDGDRIRSWEGLGCAERCEYFELRDFYATDKTFYETFGIFKNMK